MSCDLLVTWPPNRRGTSGTSPLLLRLCKWLFAMSAENLSSEIDNDLLIAEVSARVPLWQSRHPEHKNRLRKRALWAQVAAAVLPGDPRGGMSAFSHSAAVGYCFIRNRIWFIRSVCCTDAVENTAGPLSPNTQQQKRLAAKRDGRRRWRLRRRRWRRGDALESVNVVALWPVKIPARPNGRTAVSDYYFSVLTACSFKCFTERVLILWVRTLVH